MTVIPFAARGRHRGAGSADLPAATPVSGTFPWPGGSTGTFSD